MRTCTLAPRRWRRARGTSRTALLIAVAVLAACDDAPLTAPSQDGARFAAGELSLRDPDIDLDDTWLVTEATTTISTVVQYDVPTWDPVSGSTVTSVSLPVVTETQRTEAGYGVDGVIRINEYFSGDAVSGVAHVRIVGDSVAYFDADGQPRLDLPGAELVATLGSFANQVVTDSVIIEDYERSEGGGDPDDPMNGPTLADPLAPAYSIAGRSSGARREVVTDIGGAGGEGRFVRYYRRVPQGWVLDEERRELRHSGAGAATTTTEVTRYHAVAWRNDVTRDAARRGRASRSAPDAGVRAGEGVAAFARSRGAGSSSSIESVASQPQSSLSYWIPQPIDPARSPSAPLNIALQHGAFSSGATWSSIAPVLTGSFDVDLLLRETSDWRRDLESQSRGLHGRLAASGKGGFLLIGHSNGGLVARRAAQISGAAGDSLVRGVVTIASGHAGVPLAKVARETVHGFLTTQLRAVVAQVDGSCWRAQFAWLCDLMNLTSAELPGQIATFAMDSYMPMSRDVQPGSAFLAQLNSTPESFRRYSIEVSSQGQWKFLRLFGDWRCDPSSSCGGNKLQNSMESVYEILRICGSNTIMRAKLGHVSARCRDARWTLSSLNAQYERWTAPDDQSDGLIPLKSQQYPGAAGGRITRGSSRESHASELRSGRIASDLVELVRTYVQD